jgi:hypothetical protein
MEKLTSRAALDAWLAQAEEVLQDRQKPDTCEHCEEESVQPSDAA